MYRYYDKVTDILDEMLDAQKSIQESSKSFFKNICL